MSALVSVLLSDLHDGEWFVWEAAATSLGKLGVASHEVVNVLLKALYNEDVHMREGAVQSLGRLEIKETTQLRKVLVAFNRLLHTEFQSSVRVEVLTACRQLLDGHLLLSCRWCR